MPLVTTKEMFEKAYNGGYAVGAFNVNNMEIVQGITEAAGELKSPVILQVSKGARNYANQRCTWTTAIPLSCANPASTAALPPLLSTPPPSPLRRTSP